MPPLLSVLLLLGLMLTAGCTATRPSAQPASSDEKPDFDLPDLERRVLHELNAVRARNGAAPLTPDSALAAIARAHSDAMQQRGFFAHRDPDGRRGGDRARAAGYRFHTFGENLYHGHLYDTITRSRIGDRLQTFVLWHTPETLAVLTVQSWLESPGHRENMLSSAFDWGGVGIAVGGNEEVFITLNLSAR